MNTVIDLLVTSAEIHQFLDNPLKISDGCCGSAIPDGIDPQHPITLGQPKHDVFLAKWIAIPIVAEADDFFTFDHIDPLHMNGSGSGWT